MKDTLRLGWFERSNPEEQVAQSLKHGRMIVYQVSDPIKDQISYL